MFFDLFTNVLFPPVCIVCRNRIGHGVVCDACIAGIPLRTGFLCGECHGNIAATGATPSPALIERGALPESPCHPGFPYLLAAATDYGNPVVQSLIHNLKFRSIKGAAQPLAAILVEYLSQTGLSASLAANHFVAVPVPLSPRRLRTRGYNQTELIARSVACELELPLATDLLARVKHAKPQSDIDNEAERRENIRGAYAVPGAPDARAATRDANILLIDDVSTTGATFLEAARALKSAGAARIVALAAAKT